MLARFSKTINLSAVSVTDVIGDTGVPVMIMNASIAQSGEVNMNTSIPDNERYDANYDQTEKDLQEFRQKVREARNRMNSESGD